MWQQKVPKWHLYKLAFGSLGHSVVDKDQWWDVDHLGEQQWTLIVQSMLVKVHNEHWLLVIVRNSDCVVTQLWVNHSPALPISVLLPMYIEVYIDIEQVSCQWL